MIASLNSTSHENVELNINNIESRDAISALQNRDADDILSNAPDDFDVENLPSNSMPYMVTIIKPDPISLDDENSFQMN